MYSNPLFLNRDMQMLFILASHRWFRNGDHPGDYSKDDPYRSTPEYRKAQGYEGDVVRYFRHPNIEGDSKCNNCGHDMHDHGWLDLTDNNGSGQTVCPGDWILTDSDGKHYACSDRLYQLILSHMDTLKQTQT